MQANTYVPWQEEEILFFRNNTHLSDAEIAEKLNRTILSIFQKRRILHKPNLRPQNPWSEEEVAFLKEHAEKGDTYLAKELKRTIESVKGKRHKLGLIIRKYKQKKKAKNDDLFIPDYWLEWEKNNFTELLSMNPENIRENFLLEYKNIF